MKIKKKFCIKSIAITTMLILVVGVLIPADCLENEKNFTDQQFNEFKTRSTLGEPIGENDDNLSEPISSNKKNDVTMTKDGVIINKHNITRLELEKLRNKVGTYNPKINYNEIIDGHGTGLRPPATEEWSRILKEAYIVDDISKITSPYGGPDRQPPSVDNSLDIWFPPIGTQDGEGSCVTWAVGYYTKTYQEAKEHNWNLSGVSWTGGYYGNPDSQLDKIFSPDFIYHQINNGGDNGAYYDDAFNLIERIGACTWDEMPNDPTDSTTYPSESAYRQAPIYRADTGYNYMPTETDTQLDSLKDYLADDHLTVISIDANLYPSLIDTPDGDLWTIDTYVNPDTNHANTIVGYDDNFGPYTEEGATRFGAFKVANSWETGWDGDWDFDGFFWISYETMKRVIEFCMFGDDLVGYNPELISVFQIDHTKRGECDITLGMGSTSSPIITKQFNPQYWGDGDWGGGSSSFPNNKIILDITEFNDSVLNLINENFFLNIYDTNTTTTGTIVTFSVEYFNDYFTDNLNISKVSDDPPVNTIQFTDVYAQLILIIPEHDIGVESVNYPLDNSVYSPGDYVVNATVKNNGNNTETFDVNCSIYKLTSGWLYYDTGGADNAYGMDDKTWETAIRLTPDELAGYNNFNITAVKFYHGYEGASEPAHSGQIKIYEGNTPTSPGSIIATESFTTPPGYGWVEVPLSTPVFVDDTQEYWVSVEITQYTDEYPFGVDNGPVVSGKGGWYSEGGVTWSELEENENWKIWAKAETSGSSGLVYWNEQTVTNLVIGAQEDVEFIPSWAATPGRYMINITSKLFGDEVVYNNVKSIFSFIEGLPDIWVNPDEFQITLLKGTTINRNLTVGNSGTGNLDYIISNSGSNLNWSENFDSYYLGSSMHGQGGWKGWLNNSVNTAYVTNDQSYSYPYAVDVFGNADLVHEYNGCTSGNWTYTAWQYIPNDFSGDSYFIILDKYSDSGGLHWAVQIGFNSGLGVVESENDGHQLPLITDQWIELRTEIDFDADWFQFYYGGSLLVEKKWTDGFDNDHNGHLDIGAVDLWANGASSVYYDNLSLVKNNVEVDWLSFTPNHGIVEPTYQINITARTNSSNLSIGKHAASILISSNDPDENSVIVPFYVNVTSPVIEINKMVWNPEISEWVDYITLPSGSTVRFNISIHNSGTSTTFNLTNIVVTDYLPDSLEYMNDAFPREPDSISPDGKVLNWSFPDPLPICNWIYIEFNATITGCDEEYINLVNVSGYCDMTDMTVYDEDTASVFDQSIPSIEVNKTVWDPDIGEWVDYINSPMGSTVRFNISIHNNGTCCDLTNIVVTDYLPDSLEYMNDAFPREPDSISPDGKVLNWSFPDPLPICNWIYIEFNATITGCDEEYINLVNVSGYCDMTDMTVYDEDTASVFDQSIPSIEVNKTVWDPDIGEWVDYINSPMGSTVRFNISIHNNGIHDVNPDLEIFFPTDDAVISMSSGNQNNGDSTFLKVRNRYGKYSSDWEADSLIHFDTSSIPLSANINSATLNLYYTDWDDNNPEGRELTCYRITSGWNEDTVTWNTRPTKASIATSSAIIPDSKGNWMSWNVTNDVQDFVNDVDNFGWWIMDEDPWEDHDIPITKFYSKEYGNYEPYLEIDLSIVDLTSIIVTDYLPDSLEYMNGAFPREPDSISPDGKVLNWSFPDPLPICNWIYIEFNATITGFDEEVINLVNVSGYCDIADTWVVDEDEAIVNSGEITVDIPLTSGWNQITIPVENNWMASTLGENITGCTQVSYWNNTLDAYQDWLVDYPDPEDDYPIEDGRSYFVYVNTNSLLQVSGSPVGSVSVPLGIGWNMLGWNKDDYTMASSLGENITGCTQVSYWNNTLDAYQDWLVDYPDPEDDYPISQGMGFFVYTDESSVWHGEG